MAALGRLRSSRRVQRIPLPDAIDGTVRPGSVGGDTVEIVGPVTLPVLVAGTERVAHWHVGRTTAVPQRGGTVVGEVSVLQFGETAEEGPRPLVRVHSACLTGDALGSLRCDCGPQLEAAVAQIAQASRGSLLVYMTDHEGRGIGLWSKAAAYLLQEEGLDTYAANRVLGFAEDERDFRLAAAVIDHFLGERPFELLTNNPEKVQGLERFGVTGANRLGLVVGASSHNECYLRAKRGHGHLLSG